MDEERSKNKALTEAELLPASKNSNKVFCVLVLSQNNGHKSFTQSYGNATQNAMIFEM